MYQQLVQSQCGCGGFRLGLRPILGNEQTTTKTVAHIKGLYTLDIFRHNIEIKRYCDKKTF